MKQPKIIDIKGIGPAWAKKLADNGVTDVAQVAEWTRDEIMHFDKLLGADGRIEKEHWVSQASLLLAESEGDGNGAITQPAATPEPSAPTAAASGPRSPGALEDMPREELISMIRALGEAPAAVQAPARAEAGNVRRRLNRNRDYADIHGSHYGAHHMQVVKDRAAGTTKALYFDSDGVEIPMTDDGHPVPGYDRWPIEGLENIRAIDWEDVHFINFLDGRADYPWNQVQEAIWHTYKKKIPSVKQAKAFLHGVFRSPIAN